MKQKRLISIIVSFILVISVLSACSLEGIETSNNTDATTVLNDVSKSVTESGTLVVNFFDVGQGDSEFIQLPNGETMLIDAGETDKGSTVVSNLEALGISEITYLIATHPHSDHIGGLPDVIDEFDIGTVYMPNATASSYVYDDLLTAIEDEGCDVIEAKDGVSVINDDNMSAYFIAPFGEEYSNLNNYSAVLKLIYGDVSFLFMGDAEEEIEKEITDDVSADVIKVGHHGSSTSSSSDFVSRVGAKYAVFEVGIGNSYGHPTEKALSNWQSVGATILRTDLNSNIIISTNGVDINVLTDVDYLALDESQIFSSIDSENDSKETNTQTSEDDTNSLENDKESTTINISSETTKNISEYKWVINTSSKKIHKPDCSSVQKISEKNYAESNESLQTLIDEGYTICKVCNPEE